MKPVSQLHKWGNFIRSSIHQFIIKLTYPILLLEKLYLELPLPCVSDAKALVKTIYGEKEQEKAFTGF